MTTSTDLKTFKIAKGTKAQIVTAYNNGDIGDTDFAIATDESYATSSDLTTKADIDLSNLNATGKSLASGLGLPSSRYTTLTLGASDTSYTAPANGWFSFTANSPNTSDHDGIYIMNTDAGIGMSTTQIWGRNMYVFAPALSGQKVTVSYISSITNKTLKFIYAEGEN